MSFITTVCLVAGGLAGTYIIVAAIRSYLWPPKPLVIEYKPSQVGDITLEELEKYDGRDPYRPLLFAVRGRVFDVTEGRAFYGPGSGYAVFAGKEISRALAKMAINADECNDKLDDLSEREKQVLADWETRFLEKYAMVGRVVPPRELSLAALAAHDGRDPEAPPLLAVRGRIYDVTKGKDFYGPDGVYPFAGRECARALAKFSTTEEDCVADLEGCSLAELDALRDWEARFYAKYPIVGRVVA